MTTKEKTPKSNAQTTTAIVCFSCGNKVNQPSGTRRTLCPYCGCFFDRGNNSRGASVGLVRNESLPMLNLENDSENTSQNREDSGRKNKKGITNFFSNLRNKSGSGSKKTQKSENSNDIETNANLKPLKINLAGKSGQNSALPPLSPKGQILSATGGSSPRPPNFLPSQDVKNLHVNHTSLYKAESQPFLNDEEKYPSSSSCRNDNPELNNSKSSNGSLKLAVTDNDIKDMYERAAESSDYAEITSFYCHILSSFDNINSTFKKTLSRNSSNDPGDPEIKMELLDIAFTILDKLPTENQHQVVRCTVNCLLQKKENIERKGKTTDRDELRGLFILLQNPLNSHIFSFVVFAHLQRTISCLTDYDHHFLVRWIRRMPIEVMCRLVGRLHNFLSVRLFPPGKETLPPLNKCTWWIPSCVKVLALVNAANTNHKSGQPLSYTEFYNYTLDHLDLSREYFSWQNPGPRGSGFNFCQYPFILSIQAKRFILQKDSEQQMIVMARKTLVDRVQKREVPDITMLFLNLKVRRSHLVTDSLIEISRKQPDLKKKLRVTFAGEPGLDMGGLTKEWFLLLVRQVFQTNYGMFSYDNKSRVFWFQTGRTRSHQEFHLIGALMGLAVYNSINLDIKFPPICYKKLLSPPVVPTSDDVPIGICPVTLDDLQQVFPDLTHGLRELLSYDGDVESDMCASFQISFKEPDKVSTHDLLPDGANILVNNENRKQYVDLYCDFLLNKVIYRQFRAFYLGFHSVCASNALIMLRPEEVEYLVCGSPKFNITDLSKVVIYDGYQATSPVIKHLWEALSEMSLDLQKLFLYFTTGSDRIPVGGMPEMNFRITRTDNTDMLPVSHTCFNQLVLPPYRDKKILKLKLLIAMENSEGFGIR